MTSPQLAKVFVVGGFFNLIVINGWLNQGIALLENNIIPDLDGVNSDLFRMDCCVGSICNDQLVEHVENTLLESQWFKRSEGKDHIIVRSHFGSRRLFKPGNRFTSISKCHSILFEKNILFKERMGLAATYVGNKCKHSPKTHDIAFIGKLRRWKGPHKRGHWQEHASRVKACSWLKENNTKWDVSICGPGAQCPALAQARMGLHLAGDSPGSNRLMDILLSDTVPVLTDSRQYNILPPFFPWRQMSVFAPVIDKEEFLSALAKAPVSTVAVFNSKNKIADRMDWRHSSYLFEQYMRSVSLFLSLPQSEFLHALNMSSPHFLITSIT